jgi:large subunit ribosomal protein L1
MKKNSKKYAAALKKYDSAKVYEIAEAAKLVKETSVTKFDSTVDLAFRLNVDPTLADQLIRGTISLPHGNGKTKKVLALTMTKAARSQRRRR